MSSNNSAVTTANNVTRQNIPELEKAIAVQEQNVNIGNSNSLNTEQSNTLANNMTQVNNAINQLVNNVNQATNMVLEETANELRNANANMKNNNKSAAERNVNRAINNMEAANNLVNNFNKTLENTTLNVGEIINAGGSVRTMKKNGNVVYYVTNNGRKQVLANNGKRGRLTSNNSLVETNENIYNSQGVLRKKHQNANGKKYVKTNTGIMNPFGPQPQYRKNFQNLSKYM